MRAMNRWWIAFAGVCLQMALGSAYAWSVFRIPLSKEFGWTISQVTIAFTISWFFLGCAALLGGLWMHRAAPRTVAITGGLLWGIGVFLASFSAHKLWWLYLSYGVIGGTGLGMGYIVPISVLVKWFPDRRGLITGIAVGGFGAGSLIAAPVAHSLIEHVGVMTTFAYLGVAYAVVAVAAASFMRNPPEKWHPEGWQPSAAQTAQRSTRDFTLGRGAHALAVVGHLPASLHQHHGGSIHRRPSRSDLSGDGSCHGSCRSGARRHHQHRQWTRPRLLGLGFRPHQPQNRLLPHVSNRRFDLLELLSNFFASLSWPWPLSSSSCVMAADTALLRPSPPIISVRATLAPFSD